ncbi:undecaprenyldiphospho-muramoylpentapeptide beta-N-acetylglucosaminyltransferase [Ferrovibrio sp.]|uniref:undecaprenyldiphospho-muramoylpentapeptide beta-N-acetylglucosaminyltransferase n=1 Tax=Ferrovibrio sp. TaxID=1917215 RepID=UPI0035ADE527
MKPQTGPILLAAGGTGGHVFPAEALAAELASRGHAVAFVTDPRGKGFGGGIQDVPLYRIPAGTPTGRNFAGKLLAGTDILRGILAGWRLLKRLKPAAAIGFGGYPALPLMLAATQLRLPSLIHEQNAVLGRVNRLLAKRVNAIALSFAETRFLPAGADATLTGNPVRAAILQAAAGASYAAPLEEINLLVLGGSQGARVLSDAVPAALVGLPADLRGRLRVTQQCRPEDLERVRAAYAAGGIAAETAGFFSDVAARMTRAHLLISRAGASTTSEIAAIGRPSLLVPYAHATDDHQTANAQALVRAGAAVLVPQAEFTAERVASEIAALLAAPAKLAAMAQAARELSRIDAAQALADLVEETMRVRQAAPQANDVAMRGLA